jgi:hypothetical protein
MNSEESHADATRYQSWINNRFAGLNVEVEEHTEEGGLVNAASGPNARWNSTEEEPESFG